MGRSGGNTSKGNGAQKRMGNPRNKETRVRCWERGERRKEDRRRTNDVAASRNALLRATGEPTPWELARRERVARRAAQFESRHAAWHKTNSKPVPSDSCTVCAKTKASQAVAA